VERSKNNTPRYAIRLDDLRAWHVIVATCASCGRRTHIGVALLQPSTACIYRRSSVAVIGITSGDGCVAEARG
jgi:hypothetical protein